MRLMVSMRNDLKIVNVKAALINDMPAPSHTNGRQYHHRAKPPTIDAAAAALIIELVAGLIAIPFDRLAVMPAING